jgi:hypothetical protein
VTGTPSEVEFEIDAGYEVEFEVGLSSRMRPEHRATDGTVKLTVTG